MPQPPGPGGPRCPRKLFPELSPGQRPPPPAPSPEESRVGTSWHCQGDTRAPRLQSIPSAPTSLQVPAPRTPRPRLPPSHTSVAAPAATSIRQPVPPPPPLASLPGPDPYLGAGAPGTIGGAAGRSGASGARPQARTTSRGRRRRWRCRRHRVSPGSLRGWGRRKVRARAAGSRGRRGAEGGGRRRGLERHF